MTNGDQPVSAGPGAAEAMKALAHATRDLDDKPEDTFSLLGDMLSITSSYVSILDNLAHTHERKIDDAHDDQDRNLEAGRALALAAARSVRRASFQIADAYRHLDHATAMSRQIVWFPDTAAPTASHQTRTVAPSSTGVRGPGTGAGASPTHPAPTSHTHAGVVSRGRSL